MRGVRTLKDGLVVNPATPSLSFSYRQPPDCFQGVTSGPPVRRASRFTAPTESTEGRLRTHSFSRDRLRVVWASFPRPSMQFHPSHHAEDIGATFTVLSSFIVLMRTTGVPR